MHILGISAYYHDAAACLVRDGEIVAAAQEERFTRKKHDQSFPAQAILYCLRQAGLTPEAIDHVVFYDKPFQKFERIFETYLAFAPRGFGVFRDSASSWLTDKLFQKRTIARALGDLFGGKINWETRLLFSEHHLSHAASAFFPSPFERAAVLTMDGVGEWATTSLAIGAGNRLSTLREIKFPHSLGLLYSAMTYYTGFKVNSGEYKLMGLAPYGTPRFADLIREKLIDVKDDGSFHLDLRYFDYCTGKTMTNAAFDALFGGPPRRPETELTQKEMDLAASIQLVLEDVVVALARNIAETTGETDLCLAGGVALNCVANGRLARERLFERIWIQPAAGDAGGAIGAALGAYHMHLGGPRTLPTALDGMKGAYLGPEYDQAEIERRLDAAGCVYARRSDEELIAVTAQALADGKAVGWHQGRMEFGPRALGGRSILADPRAPFMQKLLNQKIKQRESFRPFAPSILSEAASDWFELETASPYMMFVAQVAASKRRALDPQDQALRGFDRLTTLRSEVPAVTHVDGSARVQTVHRETNPRFHALIARFGALTGCPILVNTSFNVRGEPIVESPEDAFRCFMGTDLDLLVVGNALAWKSEQSLGKTADYAKHFAPD